MGEVIKPDVEASEPSKSQVVTVGTLMLFTAFVASFYMLLIQVGLAINIIWKR